MRSIRIFKRVSLVLCGVVASALLWAPQAQAAVHRVDFRMTYADSVYRFDGYGFPEGCQSDRCMVMGPPPGCPSRLCPLSSIEGTITTTNGWERSSIPRQMTMVFESTGSLGGSGAPRLSIDILRYGANGGRVWSPYWGRDGWFDASDETMWFPTSDPMTSWAFFWGGLVADRGWPGEVVARSGARIDGPVAVLGDDVVSTIYKVDGTSYMATSEPLRVYQVSNIVWSGDPIPGFVPPPSIVPVPAAAGLLATGLGLLVVLRRRARRGAAV